MGEVEHLWIAKVGHKVLARLLESQIWYQTTGSVRGGLSKGTMASACPNARPFSLSLCTTGALQAATPVLTLRGSESKEVSLCADSSRRTA